MNINITGKDFELTDAIRNYIDEKVGKLKKYIGDEFDASVTLKMDGNKQVAEIRITVAGILYKSVTASNDLYASIDKDIDILEGQIRKNKDKKDKQNKSESIKFSEAQKTPDASEVDGKIIKSIYYSIKPMTEDDAMLILKSDSKNKFLPFINVNTNKVNVVYKLKDGKNFGILEPEE